MNKYFMILCHSFYQVECFGNLQNISIEIKLQTLVICFAILQLIIKYFIPNDFRKIRAKTSPWSYDGCKRCLLTFYSKYSLMLMTKISCLFNSLVNHDHEIWDPFFGDLLRSRWCICQSVTIWHYHARDIRAESLARNRLRAQYLWTSSMKTALVLLFICLYAAHAATVTVINNVRSGASTLTIFDENNWRHGGDNLHSGRTHLLSQNHHYSSFSQSHCFLRTEKVLQTSPSRSWYSRGKPFPFFSSHKCWFDIELMV